MECPPYNGFVGIDREKEVAIPIGEHGFLVFPQHPIRCDYVRVVKKENFEEIAYWIFQEWEEDPICVMGAIMGLLSSFAFGDAEKISSGRNISLDIRGGRGILEVDRTEKSDETSN